MIKNRNLKQNLNVKHLLNCEKVRAKVFDTKDAAGRMSVVYAKADRACGQMSCLPTGILYNKEEKGKAMKRFLNGAFKIIFSRTLLIILMLLLQIVVLLGSFQWLGQYMGFLWEGMSVLGALLIIYITNRDEPAEFKMSWIIPICLFPVFGALIYVYVTGNYGAIGLKKRLGWCMEKTKGVLKTSDAAREAVVKCPAAFQGFAHYMEHTAGFPVYHNSDAYYYALGEEKYEDLLIELKRAEKFIFLEYFIIDRGQMWDSVLEILKEKVQQGVEVRVMYDGMCSLVLLPYQYPKKLEQYGIKAKMFSPIVPFLSTAQNNRDHRKILIIDGKVAYTGGINLADEYINRIVRFGHWKDVAVKITGEAVKSFTVMFLQMWNVYQKSREKEDYAAYLEDISYDEPLYADGFVIPYGDTPTRTKEVGKTVYASIFNGATRYVHIMTPYFIVDREFIDTMRYAAQRGVEVVMILPHIPDKRYAFYIARTFYPELLKAGVQVYEYTPGFVHAKVFVSDDVCATVGTVNLDYRSFYHHFECGAYFYENRVVGRIEEDFQKTLEKCQPVTKEYYKQIPIYQKLLGRVLKLVAPLM